MTSHTNSPGTDEQLCKLSLAQFCEFVDQFTQRPDSLKTIAAMCENQAETVRINQQDVNLETIDLLLDTMLNSFHHIAEAQQRSRWTYRVKSRLLQRWRQKSRKSQSIPALGSLLEGNSF